MNEDEIARGRAAQELMRGAAFPILVGYHLGNLTNDMTDSDDPKDVLKYHGEFTAIREFVESVRQLATQMDEKRKD